MKDFTIKNVTQRCGNMVMFFKKHLEGIDMSVALQKAQSLKKLFLNATFQNSIN